MQGAAASLTSFQVAAAAAACVPVVAASTYACTPTWSAAPAGRALLTCVCRLRVCCLQGMAWLDSWGNFRYVANQAFIGLLHNKLYPDQSQRVTVYSCFARKQARIMLGETGRSFVVSLFPQIGVASPRAGVWQRHQLEYGSSFVSRSAVFWLAGWLVVHSTDRSTMKSLHSMVMLACIHAHACTCVGPDPCCLDFCLLAHVCRSVSVTTLPAGRTTEVPPAVRRPSPATAQHFTTLAATRTTSTARWWVARTRTTPGTM